MAKLNPFKARTRREDDEDDAGEEIDAATFAGGGLTASTGIIHHALRVSTALQSFLFQKGVLGSDDAENATGPLLKALLDKPVVTPPTSLLDRSHPLPEYFISSSHNTYLMSHQLFGASSAAAYETTLKAGARCIEIDAW
jgi:phosphatidylinositol phospholipase C delta